MVDSGASCETMNGSPRTRAFRADPDRLANVFAARSRSVMHRASSYWRAYVRPIALRHARFDISDMSFRTHLTWWKHISI